MIYQRFVRRSGYNGFAQLVLYVTTRETPLDGESRIADEDIALRNLGDLDSAIADMDAVAAQRHGKCKDPTFHATISWRPGEEPTSEEMFLAADELLRELKMHDSQAVFTIHRDTGNLHVHIAASRISLRDFRTADLKGDFFRGERLMRELEIRFGREHDIGKHYVIDNGRVLEIKRNRYEDFDINAAAQTREVRKAALSFQSIVLGEPRDAIKAVLDDPKADWRAIHATLARYDLAYRLYRRRDGSVQGGQIVDIADPKHKRIGASKLDPRLAYETGPRARARGQIGAKERFGPLPDVNVQLLRFSTSTFARFEEYVSHVLDPIQKATTAARKWDQLNDLLEVVGLRYSWAKGKGARIHDIEREARYVTPTDLGKKSHRWLRYTELKARFGDFPGPGQRFEDPSADIPPETQRRAAQAAAPARESQSGLHYEAARNDSSSREPGGEGPSRDRNFGDVGPNAETYSARAEQEAQRARIQQLVNDPTPILDALTQHESVFTIYDLEERLKRAGLNEHQRDAAIRAAGPAVVPIRGREDDELYTTVEMREREQALNEAVARFAARSAQPIHIDPQHLANLDSDQENLVRRAAGGTRLLFVRGAAGAGKSYALGRVKNVFENAGFEIVGASLAGIAAERLEHDTGIESMSNAALLHRIGVNPETLGPNTVLSIDEANLTGTRQARAIFDAALQCGVRLVMLVGDEGQLQAVEAGDAFRRYCAKFENTEYVAQLGTPRRQIHEPERAATKLFFDRSFREGVEKYFHAGTFTSASSNDDLREQLIAKWDELTRAEPAAFVWVQSSRNWVVDKLNAHAHEKLHERGELGEDACARIQLRRNDTIKKDTRAFAVGECVRFGAPKKFTDPGSGKSVDVKNGTLAKITKMHVVDGNATKLRVQLLRTERGLTVTSGETVDVVLDNYNWLDYGYGGTDYKGEGLTAKYTLWAVGKYDKAQNAYIALSRHTHRVWAFFNARDFKSDTQMIDQLGGPIYKRTSIEYEDPALWAGIKDPVADFVQRSRRLTITVEEPTSSSALDEIDRRFANEARKRGLAVMSEGEFKRGFTGKPGLVIDRVDRDGRTHLLLEITPNPDRPYENRAARVDVATKEARDFAINKKIVRDATGAYTIDRKLDGGARLDWS